MIMKKFYFILTAVASVALASCMNDEYLGDSPGTNKPTEEAINFGGGFNALTRADISGSTAANMLNKEMKVYGVKQDRTTTTNYNTVFENYTVKYDDTKTGYDEYNNGWYYVGAVSGQNIKYWDYSSADYHFVAGSPVDKFTYATDGTTGDIKTATVTGLGGRLKHDVSVASNAAAVYIADPKVMTKPTPAGTKYGEVEFTFRSMQTKVRVGIYETIPGYKITSISFYNNATTPVASDYITLNCATDNYFQGGSNVEGIVTYKWDTPGYTFAYSTEDGKKPTQGKFWEGGQFTSGVPANTSAATNLYGSDTNMATDGYFIVMPTPSATVAAPLTLTCDYTLTALDGTTKETIIVKGATATIPSTYTKWAANTAYTYLFKISDNTNGSTGTPGTDPAGLYPITFDAVVVDVADHKIGTETTVSTPSITVYQDGDVVDNGITFSTAAITVTVMNGTDDVTSSSTIEYVELASFNYGSNYEKLGASGAATSWTTGTPTLTSGKTYVIKATKGSDVAYFVLVVGSAEVGPTNP